MRSAHDRARSRHGSQESKTSTSRRSSTTDEPTVSPSASFADGFDAFILGRRSSSNCRPSTPIRPGTPTFNRSFSSVGSEDDDDEESLLPTVSRLASKLASPEKSIKKLDDSSESDQQREQSTRPGEKVRKKLARGPVHRPKIDDILQKTYTAKLTKFWNSLGLRDTFESQVADPQSPPLGGLSISSPLPIFPDPKFGCCHVGLPSIVEDSSNSLASHRIAAMDHSHLAPGSFEGPHKQRQIQDAQDMYQTIVRNAERSGSAVPPYDFVELIGKGGYGRVYKCRKQATGQLVAVKILNIDDADFLEHALDRDNTIKSFRREVGILQQLKAGQATNINMIHDAFDLHNQLWIISDYCTGGSLRTLSRANPASRPGFEEHFVVAIARELALAIKSVHDIGVIHRDIKCANVYVTEEGDIQLGDFGIVGEVEDGGSSKRRTIVGTPHYLPREMFPSASSSLQTDEAYGMEVDIWSFGITVYEAATGQPPYAKVPQREFHTVIDTPPRLEGGDHSDELRDFVAFCLNGDPKERPSADAVLRHPFIAGTSKKYPTSSLSKLIERYAAWEYKGGQRVSLWIGGGAAAPIIASDEDTADEPDDTGEWNFSTSDNFNVAFGKRYSQMIGFQDFADVHFDAPAGSGLPPIVTKDLSRFEQLELEHKELSANRGERSLDRLFNPETTPYELHGPVEDLEPISDLPLRNMAGAATTRESVIDLDSAASLDINVPTFNFDFGDVQTLKARTSRQGSRPQEEEEEYDHSANINDERRATMEWTFPTLPKPEKKRVTMDWTFQSAEPAEPEDPDSTMNLPPAGEEGLPPGFRPTLKHTMTQPIGQFNDFVHPAQPVMPTSSSSPIRDSMSSMIDLDRGLADPAEIIRPSTASSLAGSTMTDMTSGNPFDLEEDPEQNEMDRNRFSYHKQWQSEGGPPRRLSHKTMQMHSRGSSLTSTDSELDLMAPPAAAEDIFDYDYSQQLSDAMRTQMAVGLLQNDLNHWPNFGSDSGLDESPKYPSTYVPRIGDPDYPLQQGLRTNGHGLSHRSASRQRVAHRARGPQREIEFVEPMVPHPDALLEDADPQLVMEELDHLLDDFGQSLRATSRALRQHTGVQNGREGSSAEGTDSGFDSSASAAPTGDEDSF